MAACMNSYPCFFDALKCFYIDSCRHKESFSKCCSQFIIMSIQRFSGHLKYLTHKRKSVAVYTCRCHTDQYISRIQFFSCKKIFFVDHTNCKTGKVIFLLRHQSRMFCCLTADQGRTGLYASLCHTAYDLSNFFRIVLTTCNIIQEKQRFCTCTCDIIHAHGNCINSYGIMLVHDHGKFYLGSTSVCTGYQSRLFHIFERIHRESS